MSLYGKSVELRDRDPSHNEENSFGGELLRDNGETWRVEFKPGDVETITTLFRKQVAVSGDALYYRIATPKLIVKTISADTERDYETAFDELFGCYQGVFGEEVLKQFHEDD